MKIKKTIVILANSVKHNQHCVAGKCIETKQWIRPVADKSGKELTDEQAKCHNPYGGYLVEPKQKVEMSFEKHVLLINQPENYLIDDTQWEQQYKIGDEELTKYLDAPDDLWGKNSNILYKDIKNEEIIITQSLYLIQANSLTLSKNDGKKRIVFTYNNTEYNLPVTDPCFDDFELEKYSSAILCVSLGEKFKPNGNDEYYCYKIVATIFIKNKR